MLWRERNRGDRGKIEREREHIMNLRKSKRRRSEGKKKEIKERRRGGGKRREEKGNEKKRERERVTCVVVGVCVCGVCQHTVG